MPSATMPVTDAFRITTNRFSNVRKLGVVRPATISRTIRATVMAAVARRRRFDAIRGSFLRRPGLDEVGDDPQRFHG